MQVQEFIAQQTQISAQQITNTIALLDEGATIPFISRYRKERTGELDEVQIAQIQKLNLQFQEILKRKASILSSIEEQGKLNPELRQRIEKTFDINTLEDIYLPYKSKRKTKADIAKERGLEPLAKMIMAQNIDNPKDVAKRYLQKEVPTTEDAIDGAIDIISEWINENEFHRQQMRSQFERFSQLTVKAGKKEDSEQKYRDYFDWSESLNRCPSHRFLAIYRGDYEGILKMHALPDEDKAIEQLERKIIKSHSGTKNIVEKAIQQAYKKLLRPSLENERIAEAKLQADTQAIEVFKQNLRQLLMAPPIGRHRVLAIDPGYRTGCKVVCLDEQGQLLTNTTIYPHKPQEETKTASQRITSLVEQYHIDVIAIGNGTAGRETEFFIQKLRFNRPVRVFVVSEDGASIYSASSVGREEFPDYDVTVRGAVSIGRRLMDPLSELVKIDPKSLGIGQYQHEVDQKLLKESLDFIVESVVNLIGVNLNTASPYLLRYVSGLNQKTAERIVEYRSENGMFESRKDLLKVPSLGPKSFEQCAGFLRIPKGKHPLDNSRVHPESYRLVEAMAKSIHRNIDELIGNEALIQTIDKQAFVTKDFGLPTINDILKELAKKSPDPRQATKILEFDPNIRKIDDLIVGMELSGIVTNITNFGAFVDIGIKENGLIHVSEMADTFVSNPHEYVQLHQHLKVKVVSIDAERKRIQLSLKGL
ncbi:MAG: RNA-binding transcriptional accessory protein [Bacteroidales bacterium]|nr:RNA-binding transcriptional accessory protein [Bacteroidales bacterium]